MKESLELGYEPSDANPRSVLLWGFVLALVLVGGLAASAWALGAFADDVEEGAGLLRSLREPPEGPELLPDPASELARQRAWEAQQLGGPAWVDPINGIVRVPIERAMELSLEEGFPVRAGASEEKK